MKIKNGVWKSVANNTFWIHVIENKVFWLGMNSNTGKDWCHVGNGIIKENKIYLDWSDIPAGEGDLHGNIVIEILTESEMKVIEDSGNFGLSEWKWFAEKMNIGGN
ncbi:hypothetical protein [Aureivirga marina]|uniref:hypothetical protein n=1 Tax=Aureivirga marina TaxID=1182451 RepID=UPI0018CB0326|nr:hypothetical protein [Aureivirga marina]